MLEIIRDAQTRFQEIDSLLHMTGEKDKNYFKQLSEATQNAYVVMNEGMCESTTVCHECAENRDFLYAIMGFIEDLASETPLPDSYQENLDTYAEKVGDILTKIKGALAAV